MKNVLTFEDFGLCCNLDFKSNFSTKCF